MENNLKNGRDISGVTQKAFVLNKKGEILILRRSETAPRNAFKWDLPGGVLEFREQPYEAIEREIKEEAGIEVTGIEPFDVWSETDDIGEFWTTIAYRAQAKSEEIMLSYEHDQYQWVTPKEFAKYCDRPRFLQFIKRLK
jgi:8-oxo-dGTP pyrophosphatase MutT (NUDIX family)